MANMAAAVIALKEGRARRGIRTPRPARPDLGYDQEQAVYERKKPELLGVAEGRFVAFVGDEMVGPLDTFREAYLAARRAFGPGPLYVKQVLAEEPVFEPIALDPWPS